MTTEFQTNPACSACAEDPKGFHHYHCGRCNAGPLNMYCSGHVCAELTEPPIRAAFRIATREPYWAAFDAGTEDRSLRVSERQIRFAHDLRHTLMDLLKGEAR